MNRNKLLTVSFLLLSIIIIFMVILFINRPKNLISNTQTVKILPTTTISPAPTEIFSGADDLKNEEYNLNHPELLIETRLKAKMPITGHGFTIDYSYTKDKFLVKIKAPYEESTKNFEEWMEKMGLFDKNRFIFIQE